MVRVAVALGSNLGDREEAISRAVTALASHLNILKLSPLYETAPMYVEDQPAFLNGALLAETTLGPLGLLRLLKATESDIGRTPAVRNGPREIDLDLVAYGNLQLCSLTPESRLSLPHRGLIERRFVLQPLFDVDEQLTIPGLGSVSSLLIATESQAATVRRYSNGVL